MPRRGRDLDGCGFGGERYRSFLAPTNDLTIHASLMAWCYRGTKKGNTDGSVLGTDLSDRPPPMLAEYQIEVKDTVNLVRRGSC